MTRKLIENYREILIPFMKKWLSETNYENLGESDAEEFEKDFNEICDLAIKALEQEPTTKNDLGVACISRDSAIKALDYDIKSFEFKSGASEYMDDIVKLLNTIYEIQVNNIKDLPPVTPQEPRWIPVSERLPKEYSYVLVSTDEDEICATVYLGKMNDGTDCFDDNEGMMLGGDVIAWMPLPSPFEPQESEDNNE